MTPDKRVEEIDYPQLTKDLRIKSGMIAMGERIAYGSDSGIMDAAADAIEALTQYHQDLMREVEEELEKVSTNSLVGYEDANGMVEMRLTKIIPFTKAQTIIKSK